MAFFSAKTSVAAKARLLENGEQFAGVIRNQASSPLAKGAGATVTKVRTVSKDSAEVTYTITVNGQPALKDQSGRAVLVDGTWKVGTASFCALLALEQVKVPGCPAAHG